MVTPTIPFATTLSVLTFGTASQKGPLLVYHYVTALYGMYAWSWVADHDDGIGELAEYVQGVIIKNTITAIQNLNKPNPVVNK